jgi:flagellar protein FlaJ
MIQELRANVETELSIAQEMARFCAQRSRLPVNEQGSVDQALRSLQQRIKLINNSLDELTRAISLAKPLGKKERTLALESVTLPQTQQTLILRPRDKTRYLEELSISDQLLKRLKKHAVIEEKPETFYRASNAYARISNKLFLTLSEKLAESTVFKDLNLDLRKSNASVLVTTYISMLLFSTVVACGVGVLLFFFFMFFQITLDPLGFAVYEGSLLSRAWVLLAALLLPPILAFILFYFYPSSEAKSIARRIDSELPFIVIHMGSIAGSGIEPTQIFKIVGLSREYPNTRGEIRKLLNQINVYGYDLVTALRNVAQLTPSLRLGELLNGLGTTISSGGDLKTFFEKRAETLLLGYRLERERFTKVAETFMDIYISLVIATPMILLLLLVMISVAQINIGLNINALTFLIIGIVAVVNIIFLWLLSIKQPSY